MKTNQDLRLECLRMANGMAIAKAIGPNEIEKRAEDFYRFVNKAAGSARDEIEERAPDLTGLREKFRVR